MSHTSKRQRPSRAKKPPVVESNDSKMIFFIALQKNQIFRFLGFPKKYKVLEVLKDSISYQSLRQDSKIESYSFHEAAQSKVVTY